MRPCETLRHEASNVPMNGRKEGPPAILQNVPIGNEQVIDGREGIREVDQPVQTLNRERSNAGALRSIEQEQQPHPRHEDWSACFDRSSHPFPPPKARL